MKKVIKYLEKRRNEVVELLKSGAKEHLNELQEIDKAVNWLKKIDDLNLSQIQKYEIIELPDLNTGYSEYRIMNDCETDDRDSWIELRKDNYPVFMSLGDLLIIRKP